MNAVTLQEALQDFRKNFIDFGMMLDTHLVHWNEGFATDDQVRFIRVVEAVTRYAIDNEITIPFDRLILFFHRGDFDLYFRTVKAYTAWFFETLECLLTSPASLAKPLKL